MKYLILIFLTLSACGRPPGEAFSEPDTRYGSPVPTFEDKVVIKGRASVTVTSGKEEDGEGRFLYISNGSINVTYDNASVTDFVLNVNNLSPGSITGNTLSLGSVALDDLKDNNLKVCGPSGTQKCNVAIIRIYTTGSTAGFVHSDGYGVNVFASGLNPTQAIGLNVAGSVQVQTISIPSSKHKLAVTDFPNSVYNLSADMSNAGTGSYSMTLVVEYALSL